MEVSPVRLPDATEEHDTVAGVMPAPFARPARYSPTRWQLRIRNSYCLVSTYARIPQNAWHLMNLVFLLVPNYGRFSSTYRKQIYNVLGRSKGFDNYDPVNDVLQ